MLAFGLVKHRNALALHSHFVRPLRAFRTAILLEKLRVSCEFSFKEADPADHKLECTLLNLHSRVCSEPYARSSGHRIRCQRRMGRQGTERTGA